MRIKKAFSMIICLGCVLSPLSVNAKEISNEMDVNASSEEEIIENISEMLDDAENLLSLEEQEYYDESNEEFIEQVNQLHIEVEEYLKSLDSDVFYNTDAYEELINILGDLDLKVEEYEPMNLARAASWRYGDILFYSAGSTNAVGEKSLTGHTAVLSAEKHKVIEASKTKSSGDKVFHWDRKNIWDGAGGIEQLKVTTKLGKNATTEQRKKAVNYGLKQVGKPYKLKTPLWNDKEWYCSKLTNAMWTYAGYDLRSSRAFQLDGIIMVTPNDIRADANTRVIKKWGKTLPGLL